MSRDAATSVNDWQNYETAAGTNPVASAKLQLNGHDRFYQREGKYEPKTSQKKQSFWLVIALCYCNMSGCKKPTHNRNICYHPTEEILRRTVVTPHPNGQNTYVRVICRRLAKSRYAREQQAFQRSQRHREEQLSKLLRVLKARSGPVRWKSTGFLFRHISTWCSHTACTPTSQSLPESTVTHSVSDLRSTSLPAHVTCPVLTTQH